MADATETILRSSQQHVHQSRTSMEGTSRLLQSTLRTIRETQLLIHRSDKLAIGGFLCGIAVTPAWVLHPLK